MMSSVAIIILQYIMAGVFILNGNSIWTTIPGFGDNFSNVLFYILIGVSLCCAAFGKIWKPSKKHTVGMITILLVIAYLVFFIIVNPYNKTYFAKMTAAILAIGIYYFSGEKTFGMSGLLKAFRNIMLVIAAVSLVMWVLCSMLKLIPPTGVVYSVWSDAGTNEGINTFFGVYYEPQTVWVWKYEIIRNCGIFVEAPMASYCFSVAFLIEMFLTKKASIIRAFILAAAIVSTVSTTGLLIIIVSVVLYAIIKWLIPWLGRTENKAVRAAVIIIVICLFAAAAAAAIYLIADKMASGSGSLRLDDYKAGLLSWIDHLTFGNGILNMDAIKQYMGQWRAPRFGFSNSVMQILANGGAAFGLLFFGPYLRSFIHNIKKRRWEHLVFTVCIFGMFMITIFTYRYLTYFFLYYFMFNDSSLLKRK